MRILILGNDYSAKKFFDLFKNNKQNIVFSNILTSENYIDLDDTQDILDRLDILSPESTTSMQRDIMAGRPCELEDLNGTLVRLGEEVGVDTPLNRIATACMGLQIQAGMAC